MTPRFDVEIALANVLSEPVHIDVTLAGAPPTGIFDELSRVARDFFQLADAGAYVAASAAPTDAVFQVVEERREPPRMEWICRTTAIDPRIAQVFRNILVMFHQLHHPVAHATMALQRLPRPPLRTLPPLGTLAVQQVYPSVSSRLPFSVAQRLPRASRSGRRVEVECTAPIPDTALRHVVDMFELWSDVSLAAYASSEDDVWSGECAIFDALPDIMDDYTVEMPIERFGAPEVAWYSLLNLCGRIDRDVTRIAKVTIE